ncbi:hypothetical protein NN561_003617 [Cricetulus griseus]
MTSQNWKQCLAYLGLRMEAGLPLGVRCSEPTAAPELGLVAGHLPQMTLSSNDEPELETVPGLPGRVDGCRSASGGCLWVIGVRNPLPLLNWVQQAGRLPQMFLSSDD